MFKFQEKDSLADFQGFIRSAYGETDDRLYSIWDLVSNLERFTMRALKGIRKSDEKKLTLNLMISFSWAMAIANRLHLEIEERLWQRFPMHCSYCGKQPCACKAIKPTARPHLVPDKALRPRSLAQFQEMFGKIYPPESRTLSHAGVHLAEEVGEVSEAIHGYMGEHQEEHLEGIRDEIADFVSCIFGVTNSANIDAAKELAGLYYENCHVCHKYPCTCTFSSVVRFKS